MSILVPVGLVLLVLMVLLTLVNKPPFWLFVVLFIASIVCLVVGILSIRADEIERCNAKGGVVIHYACVKKDSVIRL